MQELRVFLPASWNGADACPRAVSSTVISSQTIEAELVVFGIVETVAGCHLLEAITTKERVGASTFGTWWITWLLCGSGLRFIIW